MAMVVLKEEYQNADVDQLMKDLGKHTTSKLPRYACPIFIRLSNEVETTGTFKHKKTDLQKDVMDPKVVTKDRLFWMAPGSNEYVAFGPREFAGLAGISAKL
jgi:citronellyl-CoA synthetase